MTEVKIIWAAAAKRFEATGTVESPEPYSSRHGREANASVTITINYAITDDTLLDALFTATNGYGEFGYAELWDLIEPVLPPKRTHTALSVGDVIDIDGRIYECASFGWDLLSNVHAC